MYFTSKSKFKSPVTGNLRWQADILNSFKLGLFMTQFEKKEQKKYWKCKKGKVTIQKMLQSAKFNLWELPHQTNKNNKKK